MLTLSVTAFACTDTGEVGEETKEPIDKVTYTEGVHDYTAPDIEGEWLIKEGVTDYQMLVPATTNSVINKAVEEFKILFKRATNLDILTTKDSEVEWSEDAKYISFGINAYQQAAGVEYDQIGIKDDGVRIITKGKSIFLLGGVGMGVVYAVYDFMEIYFNYDFIYRNCIEIDKDVKNAPLKAFDVTDVPDIGFRDISHCQSSETVYDVDALALGETAGQDVKNVKYRFRQAHSSNSYLLPIYQDFYSSYAEATAAGLAPGRIHNVLEFCPPNHPDCEAEWFSDGGNQLCYTARGDEDSRQRLVEYCAAKICNSLEIWPRASAPLMNKVTITIEDYTTHCNCNTCAQQMREDDNSRCGAIIRFCNDVRSIVDDWMEEPENEPYKRETLELVFFAYSAIPNAPAHIDEETGEWVAAPNCEMAEGVGVYLASSGDRRASVYADGNIAYRKQIDSWSALTDILWIWAYTGYHRNSTYFDDTLSFMNTDGFQYYVEAGTEYFFDEKNDTGTNTTAFKKLETYVEFKLAWDCTLDSDVYVDKFFKCMYKEAADTMKGLYMDLKNHYQSVNSWATNAGSFTPKQYPYPVLLRFINQIDQAYADIEHYKYSDPDLYEVIKDRIDSESVTYLYAIFNIYGPQVSRPFSDDDLQMWKARLMPIAEKYVFSSCSYLSPINGVLESY